MWEESKRVEERKTLSRIKIINLILCHLNVGIPLAHSLTQNRDKGTPITPGRLKPGHEGLLYPSEQAK